ncbi:MAG: sigma-54-dependent Fis family transcriptional regulator [Treponema sp.]|nr:sigma-54-dependent Fis family transcriptional regulator [Treponema sp.]
MDAFKCISKRMVRLLSALDEVALSPAPVLIRGEKGSGREYIARKIHEKREGSSSFVRIKCLRACPDGMFFPKGCSLFLDEVNLLSPQSQDSLFKFLTDKQLASSSNGIKVISSATSSINDSVARGLFRRDLLVLLDMISVTCPPLRERPEDIIPMAIHFLADYALEIGKDVKGFSPAAVKKLEGYSWPGNIREMRNVIEKAVLMCKGNRLEDEDLGFDGGREALLDGISRDMPLKDAVRRFKKSYIEDAIASCSGNKAEAARQLGIERTYLFLLIKELGVEL